MQLPDFISRALAFFAKAEQNLDAGAQRLADALAKITGLETEVKTAKADAAAKDLKLKELEQTIATQTACLAAKDGEIINLKSEAKTAGERAIDVVAAIGLDPAQLPNAANRNGGGTQAAAKPLVEQYRELLKTDSIKAAEFYEEHSGKPNFFK